ncbi:MAG: phosphocarrier protein HPr [Verrucomicrobia bacterium GWF2_62_7]|nr:MAG: phosphocarrier protein HPr [Verrucomicrobia bacterium GWF2_62_7]
MKSSPIGGDEHHRPLTREVVVINKQGIHARPAALFVKTATKFGSEIGIEKEGEVVNGKSIIGLLMLAAGQGTKLTLTAQGQDAEKALAELSKLFEDKFNED